MTERTSEESLSAIASEELRSALSARGFSPVNVGFEGCKVVATFTGTRTLAGLLYLVEDMNVPFTLSRVGDRRSIVLDHRDAGALTAELNG